MAFHNDILYNAALAGFVAGTAASKGNIGETTASDYADIVAEGVFFATEVDSLIANDSTISAGGGTALLPSTPTQQASQLAKTQLIENLSRAWVAGRQLVGGSASAYASVAAGLAAAYTETVASLTIP